jgi:transposase
MHNDDTGMRILQLARRSDDGRTGTFTSGIVSIWREWKIALYFSGWKHAGENLADVLKQRAPDWLRRFRCAMRYRGTRRSLSKPCWPTAWRTEGGSLRGRGSFPDECRYVLESLGAVYGFDAEAKDRGLTPEERLEFHQTHSAPVMEDLHQWMETQFAEHKTEPNSGLGKAISYLLRHWTKLTLFLRQQGRAPRQQHRRKALKKAILHRKNALFYKTMNGARVGDLFMSLIHTCELNKVNPFDYLTELLRHPAEVAVRPAEWMPWNYRRAANAVGRRNIMVRSHGRKH